MPPSTSLISAAAPAEGWWRRKLLWPQPRLSPQSSLWPLLSMAITRPWCDDVCREATLLTLRCDADPGPWTLSHFGQSFLTAAYSHQTIGCCAIHINYVLIRHTRDVWQYLTRLCAFKLYKYFKENLFINGQRVNSFLMVLDTFYKELVCLPSSFSE